jgi:hypothetical protein
VAEEQDVWLLPLITGGAEVPDCWEAWRQARGLPIAAAAWFLEGVDDASYFRGHVKLRLPESGEFLEPHDPPPLLVGTRAWVVPSAASALFEARWRRIVLDGGGQVSGDGLIGLLAPTADGAAAATDLGAAAAVAAAEMAAVAAAGAAAPVLIVATVWVDKAWVRDG